FRLALAGLAAIADQQRIAFGIKPLLDEAGDARVEGVADVRHEHGDGVALAGAQAAGQKIGAIAQTFGRIENASPGLFADALCDGSAGKHAADRADGSIGLSGNIDESRWQSIPRDNHCNDADSHCKSFDPPRKIDWARSLQILATTRTYHG